MRVILREIQDGTLAREVGGGGRRGAGMLTRIKAVRDQLPLTAWEERARRAFRIGEAAER
jgi:hypothetical protein